MIKGTTKGARDKTYSSSKLFPMSLCSDCRFCTTMEVILYKMGREIKFSQGCFHGPFRQLPGENVFWTKKASFKNLSSIPFSSHPCVYDKEAAQETVLNETHVICKNIVISAILKTFMGHLSDKWRFRYVSFHA